MKVCLHCGAALPEEASFCPYCAKSVNVRTAVSLPRRVWLGVGALAAAVLLAMLGWRCTLP